MAPRMQHCFNCGAELGVFEVYPGDVEACAERECQRAMAEEYRARDDDARERAADDDYGRYR